MAGSQINIATVLTLNDSEFKSKASKVPQVLQGLQKLKPTVKLGLDNAALEKEYVRALNKMRGKVLKDFGVESIRDITYKTLNGRTAKVKSIEGLNNAYKYTSSQTGADWDKKSKDLAGYIDLLMQVSDKTKTLAREEKALESGRIAALRSSKEKQLRQQLSEEQRAARVRQINDRLNQIGDTKDINLLREKISLQKQLVRLSEKEDLVKNGGKQSAATVQAYAELGAEQRKLQLYAQQNRHLLRRGAILANLRSLAYRYLGVYSIINFAKKTVEATKFFETQRVALEGITKSAIDAEKLMQQIRGFAVKSPFTTQELTGFVKQLSAYNLETSKLFDTTKKLADISAGLGVDMSRIVLAYGQVRSATVLRGQELRQFTEAGVPVLDELAKKLTQTNGELVRTADIFDLISKRQISFQMVDDVLTNLTSEGGKFYKMQENLNKTLQGQIAKLKDLWFMSLEGIGNKTEGTMMQIVKALQFVAKNAEALLAGGMISSIGVLLLRFRKSAIFTKQFWYTFSENAGNAISDFLRRADVMNRYVTRLDSGTARLALRFRLLGRSIKAAFLSNPIGWIAALTFAIGGIVTKVKAARREANEFARELSNLESASNREADKMIDGLDSLIRKLNHATKGTKNYEDAISTLKQNYSQYITLNDTIIDQLKEMGDTYDGLSASIRMFYRNEAFMNKRQKIADKLKESISGNDDLFYNTAGEILGGSATRSGQNKLSSELVSYYEQALDEFVNIGGETQEDFKKILSEILNGAGKTLQDYELNKVVDVAWGEISKSKFFNNYVNYTKDMNGDISKNGDIAIWNRIRKAYELQEGSVEKNGVYDVWRDNVNKAYLKNTASLLRNGDYKALEGNEYYQELLNTLEGDFDQSTVRNAEDLLNKLKGTLTDPKMITFVSQIEKLFKENTDSYAARTSEVRTKIRAKYTDELIGTDLAGTTDAQKRLQITIAKWVRSNYMPNDENYNEIREKVQSDKASLQKELDSYRDKNQVKDDETTKLIEAKIKALDWLDKASQYNIGDKKTTKDNTGRGGWRAFISDLFKVIIDARKKETSLVEGRYGYTNALLPAIAGLDKDVLKDFYGKGSPFASILDKIEEYNIESKMLNEEDIAQLRAMRAAMLTGVGPDGISVVNYEDLWNQLISFLAKKSQTLLAKGDQAGADDLKVFAQSKTTEGQMTFGRDEIQSLIEDGLRQLTKIETDLSKIQSKQGLYDRLNKIGGYQSAYRAIYGNGAYQKYDDRKVVTESIAQLLGSNALDGLKSTEPMKAFMNLFGQGTILDIDSLKTLTAIVADLEEQAKKRAIYAEASGDKTLIGEAEQFKGTTSIVTKAINQLIESIVKAFEEEMDKSTNLDKMSRALTQHYEEFLKKVQTKGITNAEKIDAVQNLTRDYIKELGGYYNESLAEITKDENRAGVYKRNKDGELVLDRKTGSSAFGDNMQMLMSLQNGGFESMMKTGFGMKATGAMGASGAAAGVAKAVPAIAIIDAIIKAVGQMISALTEFGNHILDWMEKFNDVTEITAQNGKRIKSSADLNWRDTFEYETKYSKEDIEKARRYLGILQKSSDHVQKSWENFKSGNVIGAVTEGIYSIVDPIMDLIGESDTTKENKIQEYLKEAGALQKQIDNSKFLEQFETAAERAKEMTNQFELMDQKRQKMQQAYDEELSKKRSDEEKLEEYAEGIAEIDKEGLTMLHNEFTDIVGSFKDLANQLSNSFVDAFKNGTNAARAFRDSANEYVGDILRKILLAEPLEKAMRTAQEQWLYGVTSGYDENGDFISAEERLIKQGYSEADIAKLREERKNDAKLRKEFYNNVNEGIDELNDSFSKVSEEEKELMTYNSSQSALGGSIQGLTEPTGRELEGLASAMLTQQVIGNTYLSSLSSSAFAQVQTSWFNDMLQQQNAIAKATSEMKSMMSSFVTARGNVKVEMQ